jgi:hypothetical protein
MIELMGIEHGIYKPGIEWVKSGDVYLLDQNPDSHSIFASAVKKGHSIQWVLDRLPVAGEKLSYTDKLMLDGKETTKIQALETLRKGEFL